MARFTHFCERRKPQISGKVYSLSLAQSHSPSDYFPIIRHLAQTNGICRNFTPGTKNTNPRSYSNTTEGNVIFARPGKQNQATAAETSAVSIQSGQHLIMTVKTNHNHTSPHLVRNPFLTKVSNQLRPANMLQFWTCKAHAQKWTSNYSLLNLGHPQTVVWPCVSSSTTHHTDATGDPCSGLALPDIPRNTLGLPAQT